MRTPQFTKMHGCGNYYIYFECFIQTIDDPEALSIRLSDRHKGVGGDGIIMVCPSDVADGKMRIFNADGSEAMMCGNGIRCVAKFLYDTGLCHKKHLEIDTLSGVKYCDIIEKDGETVAVTVDMGKAELVPGKIPVILPGERIAGETVSVAGGEYKVTCVSMGNPHCVIFGGDPMELDLESIGPRFEKDPIFPQGVNTEFIEVVDSHTLKMRVWERGSGETMACGTGACAAAVAACLNGYCKMGEDITVRLRGGDLVINYTQERVRMTGEAVKVFDGEINI